MFSIGVFARHARVSVRMLRHYDAIGLLPPAHIDDLTGHRSYQAAQLARLNRIVALKDLGFTLQQVGEIVDGALSADELRGMLRLRRAELETRVASDTARLRQIEARLRIIEGEGAMPSDDIQIKAIPAVRVAQLRAVAAGFDPASITPVIQPLYHRLNSALEQAGVAMTGPPIAYYEEVEGGVLVHACHPVGVEPDAGYAFEVLDLPAIAQAATVVHRGSMEAVLGTIQELSRWIDGNGYTSTGLNREVYLELGEDPEDWVTELQEPVQGP